MKVDVLGYISTVAEAGGAAQSAERAGYDGWWAPETQADAFISCAVAAERTEDLEIGTGIAVAFARNPMTVAQQANDLQALSGGRFLLGLGSQIKPHITRRYSMPWSHPAPRMREFILAIRAIWNTWATEAPLDFQGDFYTHTLMTPFFNSGPNPHGNPKIVLAAVGPLMTEAAGEVADGLLCHGFCTERYLREVTLPALARGAARAGATSMTSRSRRRGSSSRPTARSRSRPGCSSSASRSASTARPPPTARCSRHTAGAACRRSSMRSTKRGAWEELAAVIDDEVLHTFAIIGTPEEAVAEVERRFGGIATRVTLPLADEIDPARRSSLLQALRAPAPA